MTSRDLLVGIPLSLLGGLVVGVIGTFKHQVGISAATGTGLPVGLVLSLAMVTVFLLALRLAFPSRWFAGAGAMGIVGAIALLTLPGPSGGSSVILLNPAGIVWTLGPAVLAAAVVGWPRRRPRARDARDGSGIMGDDQGKRDV